MALILAPKSLQCICFFFFFSTPHPSLPTSSKHRQSWDCFATWISWLNSCNISGFCADSKHVFCRALLQLQVNRLPLTAPAQPSAALITERVEHFCLLFQKPCAYTYLRSSVLGFPAPGCITQFHFCQELLLSR